MTDDRGVVRAFSQDRQTYRDNTVITMKRKTSTEIYRQSENYYSNRNCPEILSLFNLQNRFLEGREKQIYHSVSNDAHYFNMVNYPIQSPRATPILNLSLETMKQEDKDSKFPKLTPRAPSTTGKKFPTLTSRNTPNSDSKNSMPKIKTSVTVVSSSHNKPSQAKMPIVLTEKKKEIQFTQHSRRLQQKKPLGHN